MARPRFGNEVQLFAALDRLQIDKDSRGGLAFATGWQHRERDRPMTAPGWYDPEQMDAYDLGWKTSWKDVVTADIPSSKSTLPLFARFELAKAALNGFCANRGSATGESHEEIAALGKHCLRMADAVLAAMDEGQERSEDA